MRNDGPEGNKRAGLDESDGHPPYVPTSTQYSWWQGKELGPQVPSTAWDRYSKRNLADREYTETTFGLCRIIT